MFHYGNLDGECAHCRSSTPDSFDSLIMMSIETYFESVFNPRAFVMDSVQVGKAVFVEKNYTTLGIEPRTFSYPGSFGNHTSVCWVKTHY